MGFEDGFQDELDKIAKDSGVTPEKRLELLKRRQEALRRKQKMLRVRFE